MNTRATNSLLRFLLLPFSLFCVLGAFVDSVRGQGPENTLVVVNAESEESLAVANRFIQLRGIPASNVVYLTGLTYLDKDNESTASVRFLRQIGKPIMEAIEQRGLEQQIDCITYSAGFPTRVNVKPEMSKYLKQLDLKYSIQRHAPWASITSLTYLYHEVFADQPRFLDSNVNKFASVRPSRVLTNPFEGAAAKQFDLAQEMIDSGDYAKALASLRKLGAKHSEQMSLIFAYARAQALNGDNAQAIRSLSFARSRGFHWRSLITNDTAFDALKSTPEFQEIIDGMDDYPPQVLPTRDFSATNYWGPNGWPNGTKDQGKRYYLSTILTVTGKDRSSLENALKQITRSVGADGTQPKGKVYFAKHTDARSRTRASQFDFAAQELKSLGVDAVIGKDKLPAKVKNVIGATLGSPSLDWKQSGSRFLPGALCDNFTSYGAWWEKAGQTKINHFLDAGAAGASGTVYEPYTIPVKIPSARLHAHYARGCTLAEAFYQSVSCPFQLLVVGDPLCCPYGRFPRFQVDGLDENQTVSGDLEIQIQDVPGELPSNKFELFLDGVFLRKVKDPSRVVVATKSISDGYHELRVVGISKGPITNRTSQSFGFLVNQRGHSVTLQLERQAYKAQQDVVITATSSQGKPLEIRQNSRTLGTVKSGESIRVPASKIGLGRSTLQAIVAAKNRGPVQSIPVSISIAK